jgi:hypothetical protein
MALCGLLSFNNLFHTRILTYEECQNVAKTWVGAVNDRDAKLRSIADNRGRGAFSIQIFKVALEKKGYSLHSIGKTIGISSKLTSSTAWEARPCIMLCTNVETSIAHAVCLCESGNLHDPDYETAFSLGSIDRTVEMNLWLQGHELDIQSIYVVRKVTITSITSSVNYEQQKKIMYRTKRGRKRKKTSMCN